MGDIEAAVDNELLTLPEGAQLLEQPALIVQQLAQAALDEAIAQDGDPAAISEADQALADGDLLRASGVFKDAVNAYKDALAKAESALP